MHPADHSSDERDDEPAGIDLSWYVPASAHVPGAILIAVMAALWVAHIGTGGMVRWGVSAATLAAGRYDTIFLHMFAHGGAAHIAMNAVALAVLSGPLVARLGDPPGAWLRYYAMFLASGLAGMAMYVGLQPHGVMPMVGASGAIYGLLGLLIRLPREGEPLMPVLSRRTKAIVIGLVKSNAWLIVIFAVIPFLFGQSAGLAWEAHLGGFLFGLLAGPWFLPHDARMPSHPD
ncbi:rhomboid family intramembrane serine protease [Sphingomonas aliaeris]|uniref:Rhomboid family intramembrane serine protease n=1 Tax=Sphingomonas aliaeris TaxID=2759526 RepID=A0A974NSK0_9SPHN|nr:rhomboid family intramembrane serine protease [Sphingomonas aliaeris]QQV76126.1 rhomboid family intramembrane serine protease [Sphingomonas aliaeris]